MKTIRQWFEELPPGYRGRALKNADPARLSDSKTDLCDAIYAAFYWSESPEGHDFWDDLTNGSPSPLPTPTEDPVKLRAALDAVRAWLPEDGFARYDFDRIVEEVLK